jgi:hypothetical protein
MRQGRKMYTHRKRNLIRFYIGVRCKDHHPECAQCQAWALPPPKRWEFVKNGIEEWRTA